MNGWIKINVLVDNSGKETYVVESSHGVPSDVIARIFEGLAKEMRDKNPEHYEEFRVPARKIYQSGAN